MYTNFIEHGLKSRIFFLQILQNHFPDFALENTKLDFDKNLYVFIWKCDTNTYGTKGFYEFKVRDWQAYQHVVKDKLNINIPITNSIL